MDEIDAVLAELEGLNERPSLPPVKAAAEAEAAAAVDQASSLANAVVIDDQRLKDFHLNWPLVYELKESTLCEQWKASSEHAANSGQNKSGMKCQHCRQGPEFHRLVTAQQKQSDSGILAQLFCVTRNIRCHAVTTIKPSDSISLDQQWKPPSNMVLELQRLVNDSSLTKALSLVDLEGIRERIHTIFQACNTSTTKNRQPLTVDSLLEERLYFILMTDQLYYRLYYAALTSSSITTTTTTSGDYDTTTTVVPHPHKYFGCPGMAWSGDVQPAKEFCKILDPKARTLLVDTWELFSSTFCSTNKSGTPSVIYNPLHKLWQYRFYELVHHIWATGMVQRCTLDILKSVQTRPDNLQAEFVEQETLAHPLMGEWRDVARDFPASLHAYATPTDQALDVVQRVVGNDKSSSNPIVLEMGAGTGYWAALLQARGVSVIPYDISPPGALSDNEYHAEVPSFTNIHRSTSLSSSSKAASILFLCYPPPGTDMAFSTLQHFTGDTVIHVGEWAGLTGSVAFEELLTASFTYEDRYTLSLPSWGTDAAYLTIWKRHQSNGGEIPSSPAIGGCLACSQLATRRCRLARLVQYCSIDCFVLHQEARKSLLLMQMLDCRCAGVDVDWDNPQHFAVLSSGRVGGGENTQSKRRKRRKKKKSKHSDKETKRQKRIA